MTEMFEVKTGVRQGYNMSTILFVVVLDWVMRSAVRRQRGINWSIMEQLENLDFADDLELLSYMHRDA